MATIDGPVTTDKRIALDRTWDDQLFAGPSKVIGWLMTVNHRSIGMRFIVTSFVFFLLAGVAALLMRTQLAYSNLRLMSPELYNQLMTMHGATMLFLFAVPMAEGLGLYLVPLMIGTRDMAFPRMSAFGYYIFLISGVTLYASLFLGRAPDAGWFNYVPLSGSVYSPGIGVDLWTTMITFLEISALTAAVEIIVTIFKQRAPGMSLNRMPLFVWSQLVMAFMIVFAMPPLVVASLMLALDRTIGTHFFNPQAFGDPVLWQHLFWWFGHPEVYIILLPGLGIVSAIVAAFARRPVFGYTLLVLATVAIGFLSFGLWVHHMFAAGLPLLGMSFFAAASMMIGIPSGVQIFAWIATLWNGKVHFKTPLLYVIGFIVLFVNGGITGIMLAAVPFDWQVHDSYFVVAHFHYVLIGGMVFPLLGGLHYWFPKFTGRMPSERLGKISFWITFLGINVTFLHMHYTGFIGMPRRVFSYVPELGWDLPNLITTLGAYMTGLGLLIYVINIVWSLRRGEPAGPNPWGADTLEWATPSPPPGYNFATIPSVRSRHPLWEAHESSNGRGVVVDLGDQRRELLGTKLLDADPDATVVVAKPSIWPFLTALSVAITFLGSIANPIIVLVGAVLAAICLIAWHWPDKEQRAL